MVKEADQRMRLGHAGPGQSHRQRFGSTILRDQVRWQLFLFPFCFWNTKSSSSPYYVRERRMRVACRKSPANHARTSWCDCFMVAIFVFFLLCVDLQCADVLRSECRVRERHPSRSCLTAPAAILVNRIQTRTKTSPPSKFFLILLKMEKLIANEHGIIDFSPRFVHQSRAIRKSISRLAVSMKMYKHSSNFFTHLYTQNS